MRREAHSMPRRLAAAVLASALALAGLALLLALFVGLHRAIRGPFDAQTVRALRAGLGLAFVVVGLKGLVPQTWLAAALEPLAARVVGRRPSGRAGGLASSLAAAALAYLVVGPLLLTRDVLGLPPLEHANLLQHLGTFASMSAGVAAALWTATRIVGRRVPDGPSAPPPTEIG